MRSRCLKRPLSENELLLRELTGVQDGNLPWPQHPHAGAFFNWAIVSLRAADQPTFSDLQGCIPALALEHLHDASQNRFVAKALI